MISAKNLSLKIEGKQILDEVSFTISRGQTTSIIGPNGAGKSTLIRALAGDLKLDRGELSLDGVRISALSLRALAKKRAVVMQDTAVPFSFIAAEVIGLGTAPWGLSEAESSDTLGNVAWLTDVEHLLQQDIRTLSGGERQRVQIARALAQLWPGDRSRQVLLLDEPLSALDIGQQQRLLKLFEMLHKRGLTIISVMHDMNAALQSSDHILLLKEGQLLAAGATKDLNLAELLSRAFETPLEEHRRAGLEAPLILPATSEL